MRLIHVAPLPDLVNMTQVLEKPVNAKSNDDTDIENIAYQFVAGRGRARAMPAVIGSSREHVELREAMLNQETPERSTQQQFDLSVADSFVSALKDDANTLLFQTKQTLWFLPKWAWSPAAMIAYLTVIVVALYRLLACEISR